MRFTNNPYEGFMKEKATLRVCRPACRRRAPVVTAALLARDRLRVLLPGAAQTTGQREVMLWAEN